MPIAKRVEAESVPEQLKKWRFSATGSMTVILEPTRREVIYNAAGDKIGVKTVPPKKMVFQNGYAETSDPDMVQLLQLTAHWGNDVFWHPTSLPEGADAQAKETSKRVADSVGARAERRRKGQQAALEGNIPVE